MRHLSVILTNKGREKFITETTWDEGWDFEERAGESGRTEGERNRGDGMTRLGVGRGGRGLVLSGFV